MARIAGVDIPNDKRVVVSLTYIYGIGRPTAEKVLEEVNVDENIRVKDLSEEQLNAIRHRKGLPVRGQRTKTNARTRKGKAKTVANKKK